MVGMHPIAGAPIGSGPILGVTQAVETSPKLSSEAKEAITQFLKESFKVLWENLEQLLDLPPPDHLVQWWDILLEIIRNLLG